MITNMEYTSHAILSSAKSAGHTGIISNTTRKWPNTGKWKQPEAVAQAYYIFIEGALNIIC